MQKLNQILPQIENQYGVRRFKTNLSNIEPVVECYINLANKMLKNKNKRYDFKPVEDAVRKIISWCYLKDDYNLDFTKGILLKGHTGRGKSFIFEVISKILDIEQIPYLMNGVRSTLKMNIAHVKDIEEEFADKTNGGYHVIKKYAKLSCLVIDDMGTEQPFTSNYANKTNVVTEIINLRERDGLLTFATTNLNSMSDFYDDRTVSRMHALFNVIPLKHNEDFRKKINDASQ